MNFTFEQVGTIGIFTIIGEIKGHHEEGLNKMLMRSIYGMERAVLNFKNVTWIDTACLQLISQAYFTSLRLRNPLILTNVPGKYLSYIAQTKTDMELVAN